MKINKNIINCLIAYLCSFCVLGALCFTGCGAETAESMVSDKVNESQWQKAFENNSFVGKSFKLEYHSEDIAIRAHNHEHDFTAISDGNKEYTNEFYRETYYVNNVDAGTWDYEGDYIFLDQETYLERTAEVNWCYEDENGHWLKRQVEYTSAIWKWMKNNNNYKLFEVKYGDAEYSDDLKGYVYRAPEIDTLRTTVYVLKFDSKKRLAAVINESKLMNGNGEIEQHTKATMLFTYGKQEVKLPSVV